MKIFGSFTRTHRKLEINIDRLGSLVFGSALPASGIGVFGAGCRGRPASGRFEYDPDKIGSLCNKFRICDRGENLSATFEPPIFNWRKDWDFLGKKFYVLCYQ